MGEAKDKRERLGNDRQIHISRKELVDFLNLLTTPTLDSNGRTIVRGTKDKAERDQLLEVLRQLGSDSDVLTDAWEASRDGAANAATDKEAQAAQREALNIIPETSFPRVTVDAINYLLNKVFTDLTMPQTIQLGRLERRLIAAKDGKYELPANMQEAFENWRKENEVLPLAERAAGT